MAQQHQSMRNKSTKLLASNMTGMPDGHQSAAIDQKVNLKAIQSVKFPGKHYVFEKQLGKGVQAAVWLFKMED